VDSAILTGAGAGPAMEKSRNMRSIGIDLQPWLDTGLLRIWAARPAVSGLEAYLAILVQLIDEGPPSVAVLGRYRRELRSSITDRAAHLAAVQDQLAADRAEIDRIDLGEQQRTADVPTDRLAMAKQRWADRAPGHADEAASDGVPGDGRQR
jgi:hypothetical protein